MSCQNSTVSGVTRKPDQCAGRGMVSPGYSASSASDALLECGARWQRAGLLGGDGTEAGNAGAGGEVGVGLGVAHRTDGPLDADLAAQRLPVEQHRGMRVGEQLAAFAALVVGIEDESVAASKSFSSTMRTDGRPSLVVVASASALGSFGSVVLAASSQSAKSWNGSWTSGMPGAAGRAVSGMATFKLGE